MFTTLFIFLIVLLLYIYITNQFRRSEDIEIYEMDYTTAHHLQDVCDVRQPFLFNHKTVYPSLETLVAPPSMAMHGSHDVHIKDADDYWTDDPNATVDPTPLSLYHALQLMETSTGQNARFFSEQNADFLDETGLLTKMRRSMDAHLQPICNVRSTHDLLFGSTNVSTPLQYHTYYRRFLCVQGKIRVRMAPWKNTPYLHPIYDYEQYEFRSPVHPLIPAKQYAGDVAKITFLDFDVLDGYTLYIPPYWWYSIQYVDGPSTMVTSVSYTTWMNGLVNLPNYALHWLQLQNITKKVVSKKGKNVSWTDNEVRVFETEDKTNGGDVNAPDKPDGKETVDNSGEPVQDNVKTEEPDGPTMATSMSNSHSIEIAI